MQQAISDRELLAILGGVSRSFVLTIRALPKGLRQPIGLAYLLARISDTIADTATAPAEVRADFLQRFSAMVEQGADSQALRQLSEQIKPGNSAEADLLTQTERILASLQNFPETDRREITALLVKITHGQALDLLRFPGNGKSAPFPPPRNWMNIPISWPDAWANSGRGFVARTYRLTAASMWRSYPGWGVHSDRGCS